MRNKFKVAPAFILLWNISLGQTPSIQSFSPESGSIGASVTITGTNFSSTPAENIVFFGAAKATVSASSTNSLTVAVPTGASYQPITVTVNGLVAYSSKPFIVTFTGSHEITASSFSIGPNFTVPNETWSVAHGDLDGDGKVDLVISSYGNNSFSVLRNIGNGSGNFNYDKQDFTTGPYTQSVSVGDLNADGKPDVVVGHSANTVSVFRSTSNGPSNISFTDKLDIATAYGPQSVFIGDFDGDGKADLAVACSSSNAVVVHPNTSTGSNLSFGPGLTFYTGAFPRSISMGDLNGDGKMDLVTADRDNPVISVLQNTSSVGSISFATKKQFTAGADPSSVAIGDLDGDDKPDLIATNALSHYFSVYRNTSTLSEISYASQVQMGLGAISKSVTMGDLDGDGKIDVVIGMSDQTPLYKNLSTVGNINIEPRPGFGITGSFSLSDQDGDGKLDFAVVNHYGYGGNSVQIIRNRVSGKSDQSITFVPLPSKKFGDAAFDLSASSSSGLPITYSSSDETKVTISGNTVTIKGAGTVTITASQAGNENFESAPAVSRDFTISKAIQSIDFQEIPTKTIGDATFTLLATASSGLTTEFTTSSDKISINGNQVSILKAGSVTINANQSGDDNYNAATVAQSFCINPSKPKMTSFILDGGSILLNSSSALNNQWYKDGNLIVDAVSNIYIATEDGTYAVQVTVDNCLSEFSEGLTLIVTGTLESMPSILSLYPNPTSNILTVDLSGRSENKEIEIMIYDSYGKIIEKFIKQGAKIDVSISSCSPGIYFLVVIQQNQRLVSKFLKK